MPKIGVGVPTYNRSGYLRQTLDCLRHQEDADFVVLVMDNASTDDTPAVFDEMVGSDSRFIYRRQPENVGMAPNFRAPLTLLDTEYFLWRADDDQSSPNYLAALSTALDTDPTAEFAMSPFIRRLDEKDTEIALPPMPTGSAVDRAIFLLRNARPTWIYGMWRRDILVANYETVIAGYDFLWASDHALMLPAVLSGKVAVRHDTRFIQRMVAGEASYHLAPADQLRARRQYAAFARTIVDGLDIPADRRAEFEAALEFHLNERVGPLWRLRRRAVKHKLKKIIGMGRT